LFVQYRVGGGLNTNLGPNTINQIGVNSFRLNAGNPAQESAVINSLRVNNLFPAIGGAGLPTTEEVRNFVSFNFAAQKRAVTINDYESIIRNMPPQFGAPAKVSVQEVDNKIQVLVLSYDANGKLISDNSRFLTDNIANYLSNYRMINDYIVVSSAKVIDVGVEAAVTISAGFASKDIVNNIISTINNYFIPQNIQLGKDINISEIKSSIQNLNGVITVSNILFKNLVGGNYSGAEPVVGYYPPASNRIILSRDETIYADSNEIYHIRYPERDITVKVKTNNGLTII
jgi:hypothetical protein